MSLVLGFGEAEYSMAIQIIQECIAAAESQPQDIDGAFRAVQAAYDKRRAHYKGLPQNASPERYSSFWFTHTQLYEGRHLIEFVFSHINRRHPMSPDGWAAMTTKWVLVQDDDDGDSIFREVA